MSRSPFDLDMAKRDFPSEAPTWAKHLQRDIHLMINLQMQSMRKLGRIEEKEREMRQSTQDLIDAVGALQETANAVGTAIDALVAAQQGSDDAAVEAQVEILKNLGPQLKSHLPNVSASATTVAQAPEDPGAVVAAPAADGATG